MKRSVSHDVKNPRINLGKPQIDKKSKILPELSKINK